MWIQWLAAAFGACTETTINADLHTTLEAASSAYVAFDETGFTRHVETLEAQTLCLSEVIAPSYAAAVHRVRGMGAFLAKDYGDAELHFAASRRIEPGYRFPEAVAPEGNPILDRFAAIELNSSSLKTLQAPSLGAYRLDGLASLKRDPRLPIVLQRITPSGFVHNTELLAPDTFPTPGEKIKERRRPPFLLFSGVASLAASAGLYGGALVSKSAFNDAKEVRELERIQSNFRLNRGLVAGSGALAAGGVALIAGHFLSR